MPPFLSSSSCWVYTGSGLGPLGRPWAGVLPSNEDVFADRCLCRVDVIFFIDVGRVGARTALDLIGSSVGSEDRVIAGTAEQVVYTETAMRPSSFMCPPRLVNESILHHQEWTMHPSLRDYASI